MANEQRVRQLAIGGLVEDNPLAIGGTTLTSAALAAISGGITSSQHLAIVLDPDGVDGAPEVVYVTLLTGGAGSATIARAKEGTTARAHVANTPWVHAATPTDVLGQLLAAITYNPGTALFASVSSTAFVDVDATNLAITFMVPSSGKVLVGLNGEIYSGNTGIPTIWNLREASSNLSGTQCHTANNENDSRRIAARILVTGLTPGDIKTYKWGHASINGTAVFTCCGGTAITDPGPATMEVWSVP